MKSTKFLASSLWLAGALMAQAADVKTIGNQVTIRP